MDTPSLHSLSVESFSYRWLANFKPPAPSDIAATSTELPDTDEAYSFIEMDPRLPPSKRFIRRLSWDLAGFDFPVSDSPLGGLVHADELISNGFVLPLFVKDVKDDDEWCMPGESTSTSSSIVHLSGRVRCASLRRCRRLSKRLFCKYLKFLLSPILHRRWRSGRQFERSSSSNSNSNIRMSRGGGTTWEFSSAASPRTSLAYSFSTDDGWRRSCDSDTSIYEAVLHCKRTHEAGK